MSQAKILYHEVYFRPEGTGSLQTTSPAPTCASSTYFMGTCLSVSIAKESEEAVFEKPVGGKWRDYDAVNQRDRETWTFNLNEVSPLFWELCWSHQTALAGGAATVTPGAVVTRKGWVEVVSKDDAATTIADVKFWAKLDLPSVDFPQTGYVSPTFTARKLYAAAATGTLASVS